MVQIINPLTIVNTGGGGGSEPGGDIKITAYDTTTGVISGGGFGSTAGTVYVLDRDTNTYVAQTVASWAPSSITLSTPVDLTTLEGTTSMAVVADDGTWSNKWLLAGDVSVSGWGKLYVQNSDTRAIYTVAVTSQTDFEKLYGASNSFSRQIVIGAETFYTDEVLGFQFGEDFSLSTLGDHFLAYCGNLVQPVALPSQVTSIGSYFLNYCTSLNQPLTIPSGVTSIGAYFLYNCISFDQPLTIPSTVTSIGERLLYNCRSFNQPLTILSTVTSIGDYFLYQCSSFNQPLTIPSTVTSIGDYFLNQCTSFNQPLTIPSGVTSIGERFIGQSSSFDQPLTIPSTVTSIGERFLGQCSSFNQPLTIPSGVTSIGAYFLYQCSSFNQPLTIPSTVTSIGDYFLFNCYSFSNLTVNTTARPTDINSLSNGYNTAKMYVKGVTVKGTGRNSWISSLPNRAATPFRKLINGGE